jgi:hypothetical protein
MIGNTYWTIDEPGELDVLTGAHRPTGTWYGAAQVSEPVTETVLVAPGDELHVLVGGTFLIIDGSVREVSWPGHVGPYVGDSEVRYNRDRWLAAHAVEILPAAATRPTAYRTGR